MHAVTLPIALNCPCAYCMLNHGVLIFSLLSLQKNAHEKEEKEKLRLV